MKNRKIIITNLKEYFQRLSFGHFSILSELEMKVRVQAVPDDTIFIEDLKFQLKGSNLSGAFPVFFYEFVIE